MAKKPRLRSRPYQCFPQVATRVSWEHPALFSAPETGPFKRGPDLVIKLHSKKIQYGGRTTGGKGQLARGAFSPRNKIWGLIRTDVSNRRSRFASKKEVMPSRPECPPYAPWPIQVFLGCLMQGQGSDRSRRQVSQRYALRLEEDRNLQDFSAFSLVRFLRPLQCRCTLLDAAACLCPASRSNENAVSSPPRKASVDRRTLTSASGDAALQHSMQLGTVQIEADSLHLEGAVLTMSSRYGVPGMGWSSHRPQSPGSSDCLPIRTQLRLDRGQ
jgi:hypothetical protein